MPGEGSASTRARPTVGAGGPGVVGADGDYGAARVARTVRRIGLLLLFAFVGLGATTMLGVRSRDSKAFEEGVELTVHHAAVTRGGLATPWSVRVRRVGGFDEPIRLAVTTAFLDSFDENGLDPDPSAATATDDEVIWEFDPPPGDVLMISFDARTEPAVHGRRKGTVAVLDPDGNRVVETSFTMWVVP